MVFTVVIGLGKSGIGASRYLLSRGEKVVILEQRIGNGLDKIAIELRNEGIDIRLGIPLVPYAFNEFLPLKRIILSPGIPWNHPTLNYFREKNISITGEISLGWEIFGKIPWIAITGTNGKTTVTHLIHHILSFAGIDAPMCGNVGVSVAELALLRKKNNNTLPQFLVIELSSYQIEAASSIQPYIALWTTLTPDHLERHSTLVNYRSIKCSLLENSKNQILNGDDPDLLASVHKWPHATWITTDSKPTISTIFKPSLWIEDGYIISSDGPLFSINDFTMLGKHNHQNLLMATSVALQLSLSPSTIEKALHCFPGVPHRLELIHEYKNICFYNDSKATNYDAAEVAIRALKGPILVLAGGQAKRGAADNWIRQLKTKATVIILFGESQQELKHLLEIGQYKGKIICCLDLEEAVPMCFRLAIQFNCLSVLFSPACASFDQYRDFEERGNDFRRKVKALERIF